MSAFSAAAPRGAVIFCRVIDNFGDAGVTWRLAKRLSALGFPTTLVIDSIPTLSKLVPSLPADALHAEVRGIRILDWDAFEKKADAGDLSQIGGVWPSLVLETFGCRLPDAVEKGLCDERARLYMNLDYLSAESWVEGSHGIWGLHPTLPVKKLWFFPGFTDKTGGVLIEDDLAAHQAVFSREAFLRTLGADPARRTLYFFAYPVNALEALAAALGECGEELNLILAPGAASEKLGALLDGCGHIRLINAPFVSQEAFDDFLLAADAVIIRGEDSFVRAQLAGTPLLWAVYPTSDKAHEIKLDAWLERFRAAYGENDAPAQAAFERAARAWVDGTLTPEIFRAWLDALPAQKAAAQRWRASLFSRGDLARHIASLVPKQESGR